MAITLSPDATQRLLASIKRYAAEHLERDFGDLQARLFLDYCLQEVGPVIYNQAIGDAQRYFQGRVADLDGVCYEHEFNVLVGVGEEADGEAMMQVPAFLARQLARPSGLFGRFVIGRMLNRATSQHTGMVFEDLAVKRSDRILEVGFGGGSLLERLCRAAPDGFVAGVEVSDAMLAMVRRDLRPLIEAGRLEVVRAGIDRLPYADRTFDRGCTVNTTYFWPDLRAGLSEFHRVLRPDGRLVIGITAPEDMVRAGLHERGFATHSPGELATALAATGFRPQAARSGRDFRGARYSVPAERLA